MTKKDMLEGRFKLKHSKYKDVMVCDYQDTTDNYKYLCALLERLTSDKSDMFDDMILGIAYKARRMEKRLKKMKQKTNGFFNF
jgi:hypothetical protein